VSDGVHQRQDGDPEGQGDTQKTDADGDIARFAQELGGDRGAAATTEHEPEGAKELSTQASALGAFMWAPDLSDLNGSSRAVVLRQMMALSWRERVKARGETARLTEETAPSKVGPWSRLSACAAATTVRQRAAPVAQTHSRCQTPSTRWGAGRHWETTHWRRPR